MWVLDDPVFFMPIESMNLMEKLYLIVHRAKIIGRSQLLNHFRQETISRELVDWQTNATRLEPFKNAWLHMCQNVKKYNSSGDPVDNGAEKEDNSSGDPVDIGEEKPDHSSAEEKDNSSGDPVDIGAEKPDHSSAEEKDNSSGDPVDIGAEKPDHSSAEEKDNSSGDPVGI
ncbi:unnamed protein product, partial [Cuscuta campestris]